MAQQSPQPLCPACGGSNITREGSSGYAATGIAECADCGELIFCMEEDAPRTAEAQPESASRSGLR